MAHRCSICVTKKYIMLLNEYDAMPAQMIVWHMFWPIIQNKYTRRSKLELWQHARTQPSLFDRADTFIFFFAFLILIQIIFCTGTIQ